MDNKLKELKRTNNIIQNRIREIIQHGYHINDIEESHNFYPEVIYHTENHITSTNIIRLKKGMVSKTLKDEVFNRIVCISGKIKIHFLPFRDEVVIIAPNTHLIIPETKYIIEVLEDSEIISIYKPVKKDENLKITEQETIYNKKDINHE